MRTTYIIISIIWALIAIAYCIFTYAAGYWFVLFFFVPIFIIGGVFVWKEVPPPEEKL